MTESTSGGRDATVQTDADDLPRRIGRFTIIRKLGAGGMGIVYAAYDEELDRRIAIKLLREVDGRALARMRREAQAMARISHPNVAHVYEVADWEDQLYIAIEYVKGQTLGQWLAASERPVGEVLDIMRQAGEGLCAAHEAGLVHRDFKPDNVMIGDDGRVRVLDFGLAGVDAESDEQADLETLESRIRANVADSPLRSPLTETGTWLGTPAYMSPEQFLSEHAGPSSDQFSFCVTLYEALYGKRPFAGETVIALGLNVTRGAMESGAPDATVPPRVHEAVLKGIATDPQARHSDLRTLLAILASAAPSKSLPRLDDIGALLSIGLAIWLAAWVAPIARLDELWALIPDPTLTRTLEAAAVAIPLAVVCVLALSLWARRIDRLGQTRNLGQLIGVPSLVVAPMFLVGLTDSALATGLAVGYCATLGGSVLGAIVAANARNRLGVLLWSLVAAWGVPCIAAVLMEELDLGPSGAGGPFLRGGSAFSAIVFMSTLLAGWWLPRPPPLVGAWVLRPMRLALVGLPAVWVSGFTFLYGSDSMPWATQPTLTLLSGPTPEVDSSCSCESCLGGEVGPGQRDRDTLRLELPGDNYAIADIRIDASAQAEMWFAYPATARLDQGIGPVLIPPGETAITVSRNETGPREQAYCIAAATTPLPLEPALTPDEPTKFAAVTWRRESEVNYTVLLATISGTAPSGSAIVVELLDPVVINNIWTVKGSVGGPVWSTEAVLPLDELNAEPTHQWRAVSKDGRWTARLKMLDLIGRGDLWEHDGYPSVVRVRLTEAAPE